MKKLMIAAAIVCAAAMAQAAAVVWYTGSGTIRDGYNNDGSESYSPAAQAGTIYIFNANASGVSQQALLSAILEGGTMSSIASMDSYVSDNGKMASSKKKTLAADYKDFAPVRVTEDGDYADYFYAMLVEDDAGKYLFVTETYSDPIQDSKDTALQRALSDASLVNKGETTTFSGSGWYTQAVPEPTSGLLLLVGLGALALRRRRA